MALTLSTILTCYDVIICYYNITLLWCYHTDMSFHTMGCFHCWGGPHTTTSLSSSSSSSVDTRCKRTMLPMYSWSHQNVWKLWELRILRVLPAISSTGPPHASALSNYFMSMWAVLRHDGKGLCTSILQCLHKPQCRQSCHNTCLRREQIWSMGPWGLYRNSSQCSSWMSAVWSTSPGPCT